MPISLIPANNPVWASQGRLETISPEKYLIGWTGATSDYAFAVWVNSLFNQADTRFNTMAETINAMMQYGVLTWNALYQYPKDALAVYNKCLYRAKKSNAGQKPPTNTSSDEYWEAFVGIEYLNGEIAKLATSESPTLSGVPTTPTPTNNNTQKQIVNIEYLDSELNKRICGKSTINLSSLDGSKAYPILLAKNSLATNSFIYRNAGEGGATFGNMRLFIEGIGGGLNGKTIASYLKVVNINDSSGATAKSFVKKIETRNGNSEIAIWLRGGVSYTIDQRYNETPFELIITNKTLQNNWLVSVEAWSDTEAVNDGSWNATKISNYVINYQTTSDTGSVETCGNIFYSALKTPPLGAILANGSAISRITYAKLFNKIGVSFGQGDGINTFNVPDLRGVFIRGLDLGRGLDCGEHVTKIGDGSASRAGTNGIGSYQLDAIRNMTGALSNTRGDSNFRGMQGVNTASGVFKGESISNNPFNFNYSMTGFAKVTFDSSLVTRTTNQSTGEVLVKNIALLPCIYYI